MEVFVKDVNDILLTSLQDENKYLREQNLDLSHKYKNLIQQIIEKDHYFEIMQD